MSRSRLATRFRSTATRIFTAVRWLFYKCDPDYSKYDPLPGWTWLVPDYTKRYLIERALFGPYTNWRGVPAVETPDYPPPFTWLSFWSRHGGRHSDSCRACLRWKFYWSLPMHRALRWVGFYR
jgi:hypothetical protein